MFLQNRNLIKQKSNHKYSLAIIIDISNKAEVNRLYISKLEFDSIVKSIAKYQKLRFNQIYKIYYKKSYK